MSTAQNRSFDELLNLSRQHEGLKKKPLSPADYQKEVRKRQSEKLQSLGIQRLSPFIPGYLELGVRSYAKSLGATAPIAMGAITSYYLNLPKDELRSVLLSQQSDVVEAAREFPRLKDEPEDRGRRHFQRRKLAGEKRKTMYLTDHDSQLLEEAVETFGFSNQGQVVSAFLNDLFSKKPSSDLVSEISDLCLDI